MLCCECKEAEMDKIFGRNAVLEAIKSGNRTINKIFISKTAHGTNVGEIIKLARQNGIPVNNVPPEKLDKFEDVTTQRFAEKILNIFKIKIE